MKIKFLIYTVTTVMICIGCKEEKAFEEKENLTFSKKFEKEKINFPETTENQKSHNQDTVISFLLDNGFKINLNGKKISIFNPEEEPIATNNSIIKLKDENQNCLSEGFKKIVAKNSFFTIEQQNCSNKYYIDEYITFKYDKIQKKFFLHKLGYIYTDKSNLNKKKPNIIFNNKDFGTLKFEDLNLKKLYIELINRK